MRLGTTELDLVNKKYIMGILNVTPDSFSDGGRYTSEYQIVMHALEMKEQGAAIIDIGGESTRPGYEQVSDEEEIARVVPAIRAVKEATGLPVSIDTYKSSVARAAIEAGADMINDIWGFMADDEMAALCAETKTACVLMHNRREPIYEDFLTEVKENLMRCVKKALAAGVEKDRIVLDPGIGFGKTKEQNLLLMKHLEELTELGYPVLLGTSRKSMIGKTLDLPVDQREEGTLATTVLGAVKGCSIFRVHNVEANLRALKMAEAMIGASEEV